jgi:hypothetical protein
MATHYLASQFLQYFDKNFRSPKIRKFIFTLKPHCIRCSHFKVDDVSALEASSKPPVRIVEDNVTASLH